VGGRDLGHDSEVDVELETGTQRPDETAALLAALPDWFGIPEANANYVEESRTLPTIAALRDGEVVGVCLLKRHFPESGEIELLAVHPDLHRHGVGSRLVARAEADLRGDGVRILQVKTLGPSDDYEPYARTRAFYEALGFLPLEEHLHLWPSDPCLVMVKPLG
jgi:N-acetylglutamate synthase-like GNAT family acetyltransferase